MNGDATSLDRLHDLVLPPEISWWPPAAGWYMLLALLVLAVMWLAWRRWQCWKKQAYRREALRQLAQLDEAQAIAELLRRTALAVVPRSEIAEKTGTTWADWLAGHSPVAMPEEVHQLLSSGVYGGQNTKQNVSLLRDYAVRWITHHHFLLK